MSNCKFEDITMCPLSGRPLGRAKSGGGRRQLVSIGLRGYLSWLCSLLFPRGANGEGKKGIFRSSK